MNAHARVALALSFLVASCSDLPADGGALSASDISKPWPLTVEAVTVRCNGSALLVESGGKLYQLAGPPNPQDRDWHDRREIWAPSETIPGLKRDIGELIDVATTRCAAIGKPFGGDVGQQTNTGSVSFSVGKGRQ